jgi:hypothetical protein
MVFNYDVETTLGQVRLLIGDTVQADALFQDAEISALLTLNGDDVRLAAAQGLETIAANQIMVLKVISNQGLSTNGAAVAAELRNQAKSLREQVAAGYGDAEGLFDWAELGIDDFGRREILGNSLLRVSS